MIWRSYGVVMPLAFFLFSKVSLTLTRALALSCWSVRWRAHLPVVDYAWDGWITVEEQLARPSPVSHGMRPSSDLSKPANARSLGIDVRAVCRETWGALITTEMGLRSLFYEGFRCTHDRREVDDWGTGTDLMNLS